MIFKQFVCRPPTSGFDSVLRNRYFPGGPTPDGLESDILFKNMADNDHFHERQNRRESEDMITDNRYDQIKPCSFEYPTPNSRYRMTPPESPRDRPSVEASSDNGDQKQGESR